MIVYQLLESVSSMSRLIINNLALVLTERCNFNCQHCMRGGSISKDMSNEVMNNALNQIFMVENLSICGGEPLIDYELLKMLIQNIINSNIIINEYSLTTNGTFYTKETEQLFDVLDEYVKQFGKYFYGRENKNACGSIALSLDYYHREQLMKIYDTNPELFNEYCSNITRLVNSKYFTCFRDLNGIFNVGNATGLDEKKIELQPLPTYYFQKNNYLYYGPLLTILTDGTISECDGEFALLKEYYNYGNINNDELESIIRNRSIECKSLRKFDRKQKKILKWYNTYK